MTVNLLDLFAVRNRQWDQADDGRVIILQPKFSNKWLASWLVPRMRRPFFRIKLDEFGSQAWLECDGQKTVREVAESLHAKFGAQIEPAYERLGQFIKKLAESKFVLMSKVRHTPSLF